MKATQDFFNTRQCLPCLYRDFCNSYKPFLSCAAKANLSWFGFILLAVILVVLWLSYWLMVTVLRVNQHRLARTQAARERLWKLLTPMFSSQLHSKSQAFRAFKTIRPKITIDFEDLGLTLHDGNPILTGVSGRFCHSRVAAIMGPSGAGKSTFLNVIMGKASHLGKVSGQMRANGREVSPESLKAIVGFVPQEDIVHEDLTVRENLVYSARLRLSAAKPLKEQLAIVDDVINVLQLRHVQHNVVGSAERRGISGGQRKRVNIGWELVAKPSVLFMDEPTSGEHMHFIPVGKILGLYALTLQLRDASLMAVCRIGCHCCGRHPHRSQAHGWSGHEHHHCHSPASLLNFHPL